MLIDATMKWPYPPTALPAQEYMVAAQKRWEQLGFPQLTPHMPWFGDDLGDWSEENRQEASWAVLGEYLKTAQGLALSGQKEDDA